jgi:hypothetical protein
MGCCCNEEADDKDDSGHLGWYITIWNPGIGVVDVGVVGCILGEAGDEGGNECWEVLKGKVRHYEYAVVLLSMLWCLLILKQYEDESTNGRSLFVV